MASVCPPPIKCHEPTVVALARSVRGHKLGQCTLPTLRVRILAVSCIIPPHPSESKSEAAVSETGTDSKVLERIHVVEAVWVQCRAGAGVDVESGSVDDASVGMAIVKYGVGWGGGSGFAAHSAPASPMTRSVHEREMVARVAVELIWKYVPDRIIRRETGSDIQIFRNFRCHEAVFEMKMPASHFRVNGLLYLAMKFPNIWNDIDIIDFAEPENPRLSPATSKFAQIFKEAPWWWEWTEPTQAPYPMTASQLQEITTWGQELVEEPRILWFSKVYDVYVIPDIWKFHSKVYQAIYAKA
ncbi:hypothetical protein B0H17DRAFT_1134131 [Mycena rosella]|uniref:Uncharacterized protein n=1 Tax=Mycena rosella TaxID=1033263 RepID=A0AAD7DG87_MYCRO|nr:hypothetical protein B0H17DRAFT_1134131 [Mycena rosella]